MILRCLKDNYRLVLVYVGGEDRRTGIPWLACPKCNAEELKACMPEGCDLHGLYTGRCEPCAELDT